MAEIVRCYVLRRGTYIHDNCSYSGVLNRGRLMATTTIPIERDTRDRLRSLGKKGETYDQILKRLMSSAEYEAFMDRQYERLKDKKAFVSLDEL